jgi:hypothetical protein
MPFMAAQTARPIRPELAAASTQASLTRSFIR